MTFLEKKLQEYKNSEPYIMPQEERIRKVIISSQHAYLEGASQRTSSYFEFLIEQASYIKKRWWMLQMLILICLWLILYFNHSNFYTQRAMGILASVFVIMIIPELWKNQRANSMEIESCSYFTLRQIYSARFLLFAMADILLITLFMGMVSFTVQIAVGGMILQFFIPFNITCCICFHTLCSRHWGSEYTAVALSLLWTAIWGFLVLKEPVYEMISMPVWAGMFICSILCLCFMVYRVIKNKEFREVETTWI